MLKSLARLGKWIRNHQDRYSNEDCQGSVNIQPVEELSSEGTESNILPQIDGSISYLNGNFQIIDPVEFGSYPSLTIPDTLREHVYVDGKKVSRKTIVVSSTSIIRVELPSIPPKTEISISVSEDRLSVSMAVVFHHGLRFTMRPFESTIKGPLQLDETIVPAAAPSIEELREVLQNHSFKGDIDDLALQDLSEASHPIRKVVLRGKSPVVGTPSVIKPAPLPSGYDPLGRLRPLKTIKAGTIICYIQEGTPPIAGIDVYGNPVPVREPKDQLPSLGHGVTRFGNNIIAVRSGRVSISMILVDVIPQLVLHDDITPNGGYISFDGDIVVYGSVQDGSRVKASGNVVIHGGVYGSTIIGEHGVTIHGGCVKSTVLAGWAQEFYKDILPLVQSLIGMLELLEQDLSRVLEHIEAKGVTDVKRGLVAGILIEQHHVELLPLLNQLLAHFRSTSLHQLAARIEPIVETIQSKWLGILYKHLTMPDIHKLTTLLVKYKTYIESTISGDTASIVIESATSSRLHSTGNVDVTGFGTYSSAIESGGAISVKGLVRGGFLIAKHAMELQELGSEMGAETSAKVLDSKGMIHVRLRHSNTLLDVAGRRDRSLFTQKNVHFGGDAKHDRKSVTS